MMAQGELLRELESVLNCNRNRNTAERFKTLLYELKINYNFEVTTKFLRGLISYDNNRAKTKRINYLIKRSGLTTKRINRFFKEWVFQKWHTETKIYGTDKNKPVYKDLCELTEEEKQQLKEIEEVFNKSGVELHRRAVEELKERQNIRNTINKEGKVFIKETIPQTVGKHFITNRNEVLFKVVA